MAMLQQLLTRAVGTLQNCPGGKELAASGNTIQVGSGGTAITDESLFVNDKVATANATLTVKNNTKGTYYTTIEAAITAAIDGDTILVGAGAYNLTSQLVLNKAITIQGVDC